MVRAYKKILLFFILFTATLYCDSAVLGVQGEIHSSIGIFIKDIKADTIVFQDNADRCLTPASITKCYTAASAMSLLPKDFQFETKVYLSGAEAGNGVWNGDIIIKASGDPTLDSEYFSKNATFLSELVNTIIKNNITKLNGDIVLLRVNEQHQYEEGPIDTWNINDIGWAYGCGIFDFNWCDNIFGLYPATGKTTFDIPGLKYKVWDSPWNDGLTIIRGVYSDSLIISGKKYVTDRKARINTTMPYPFAVFRATLINKLNDAGIDITFKKNNFITKKLILNHTSPRIDEILKSLMLRSDNMYAEGVLRVLGEKYGDRESSLKAEKALWRARGLEPQYNRILDGSGLSRANAISPRFLAGVLEYMAKSPMQQRFTSLFPVSGVSGTLKSFMADTPMKGRLAMKTGSVNAVQTYAGYLLDNNGQPTHVIVFMANNFFCTRTQLRDALSKFLLNKLNLYL